jgi:RNA polymerase sigma-70 factor (ECF subfamily)
MQVESNGAEALERYRPALLKLALVLVRDRFDAEDLVQRTFERALRGNAAAAVDKPWGWLRTILKNLAIDDRRRAGVRERVLGRPLALPEMTAPPGKRDSTEARILVVEALAQIPADQAQALVLVKVAGFTYVEAAELQEVPLGTLKSRVRRARLALAQLLARTPAEGGSR